MIQLSAALSRGSFIGAAMVFAVGINYLGTTYASAQNTPDCAALMAAPDRSDADRVADKRRDPVPFLAFTGLKPGMKVLDIGAGGGYKTRLGGRGVGPDRAGYRLKTVGKFLRCRGAVCPRACPPAM